MELFSSLCYVIKRSFSCWKEKSRRNLVRGKLLQEDDGEKSWRERFRVHLEELPAWIDFWSRRWLTDFYDPDEATTVTTHHLRLVLEQDLWILFYNKTVVLYRKHFRKVVRHNFSLWAAKTSTINGCNFDSHRCPEELRCSHCPLWQSIGPIPKLLVTVWIIYTPKHWNINPRFVNTWIPLQI